MSPATIVPFLFFISLILILIVIFVLTIIGVIFLIAGIYAYSKGKSFSWAVGKKASKRIEMQLNYDRTFELVFKALTALAWSIRGVNIRDGIIKADVSMSPKSWGERIHITCSSLSPNLSIIEVSSQSRWTSTLVDWGKNKENIERFENILSVLIGERFD